MSTLTGRDVEHIFQSLRNGLVPERGIETFAVGIEKQRSEINRLLNHVGSGEGSIKFLRGGYGCGKTFMARLAILDAQSHGFATSFVVVSDNDMKLHKFEDIYQKVVTELGTSSCPRGALGDILDRWIGKVEEALIAAGANEHAADFDQRVRARLDENLASLTGGKAPQDFIRVIQTVFDLKQSGKNVEAGALLSWLSGSKNVPASVRAMANVKGEISSQTALDYLRGILEIVKAAGYKGLLIVIDESETILRMRADTRHKSLNGIRQIADAAGSYPGLLWLFTGTPEFFDSRHGVAGLAPLHDRIGFSKQGSFTSFRQAQLELTPFDQARLRSVAIRLREIFQAADRSRLESLIDDSFIDNLVAKVTSGFRNDVGIVPRQFLREFVNQMDLVDQEQEYVPSEQYNFTPKELNEQEQWALEDVKPEIPDQDIDIVPTEDAW